MADSIETLIAQIADTELREALAREVAQRGDGTKGNGSSGLVTPNEVAQREYILTYEGKQPRAEIILGTPAFPFQRMRAFGELNDITWHNKLIFGDNLPVLRRLMEMKDAHELKSADGIEGVRLVYIDPPFASEADYETKSGAIAYSDKIRGAEFIEGLRKRFVLIRELMADDATIFLHLDWRKVHYIKAVMDEAFGEHAFRNEIIWKRTNARTSADRWPRIHDVILVYAVGQPIFSPEVVPAAGTRLPHTLVKGPDGLRYQTYELTGPGKTQSGESGQPWRGFNPSSFGRHWANSLAAREEWDRLGLIHWPAKGGFPRRRAAEPFREEDRTVPVGDVWTDIDRLNQSDRSRAYPTQKPEALLRRIIEAASKPGDLVLDCFAGSGTTLAVAEKLGRRWIGADLGLSAIYTSQKRLMNIASTPAWTGWKTKVSRPKPCCGVEGCEHCAEHCCPPVETKVRPPYGRSSEPFAVYSSGHYDFHQLKSLPFDEYRTFVLRLFQAREEPSTINGVQIDGRHRGDPVIVFDFNASEAPVTPDYLDELALYLAGHANDRVLFIAPVARLAFFEDRITQRGIEFEIRRVPYSAVAALQRRGYQPTSEDDINKIIETESFDFAIPPVVETEVDEGSRTLTITSFRSKAIVKGLTEEERGLPSLAMVLIDFDHNGLIFDLDDVAFGEDLANNGWQVPLSQATPETTVAISFCDRWGNEHVEVLRDRAWGAQ